MEGASFAPAKLATVKTAVSSTLGTIYAAPVATKPTPANIPPPKGRDEKQLEKQLGRPSPTCIITGATSMEAAKSTGGAATLPAAKSTGGAETLPADMPPVLPKHARAARHAAFRRMFGYSISLQLLFVPYGAWVHRGQGLMTFETYLCMGAIAIAMVLVRVVVRVRGDGRGAWCLMSALQRCQMVAVVATALTYQPAPLFSPLPGWLLFNLPMAHIQDAHARWLPPITSFSLAILYLALGPSKLLLPVLRLGEPGVVLWAVIVGETGGYALVHAMLQNYLAERRGAPASANGPRVAA